MVVPGLPKTIGSTGRIDHEPGTGGRRLQLAGGNDETRRGPPARLGKANLDGSRPG